MACSGHRAGAREFLQGRGPAWRTAPHPWVVPTHPSPLPSAIKGWFSPYHRKHQFANPRNMETFGSKVLKYVVLGAGRGLGLSSGVPR